MGIRKLGQVLAWGGRAWLALFLFVTACPKVTWARAEPPDLQSRQTPRLPAGAVMRLGYGNPIRLLAWASDKKTLIRVRGNDVFLCDAVKGDDLVQVDAAQVPSASLRGHGCRGLTFAVSGGGKRLLIAAGDGVAVVDLPSGRTRRTFRFPEMMILSIAASSDERSLAVGLSIGEIRLYDLESGRLIRQLATPGTLRQMLFAPEGNRLAAWVFDPVQGKDKIWLWNLGHNGQLVMFPIACHRPGTLAFAPAGNMLAVGGNSSDPSNAGQKPVVEIWDITTSKRIASVQQSTQGPAVATLCFAPDSRSLAVAWQRGGLSFIAPRTGEETEQIPKSELDASALCYSSDGKMLFCGNTEGLVQVWSLHPLGELQHAFHRRDPAIVHLDVALDRRRLAVRDVRGGSEL
jgi:WD40 repeat protein